MGMLKYVDTDIVFQEIPDEVTIAVNISNCPCRCKGCHSKHLWADTGEPLTTDTVDGLMSKYGGEATCFCFMGGDADPEGVASLSRYVRGRYPGMKTGWYSGRSRTGQPSVLDAFDYVKLGPYVETLGGLKHTTTNQRLYKRRDDGRMEDITSRFWRRQ